MWIKYAKILKSLTKVGFSFEIISKNLGIDCYFNNYVFYFSTYSLIFCYSHNAEGVRQPIKKELLEKVLQNVEQQLKEDGILNVRIFRNTDEAIESILKGD